MNQGESIMNKKQEVVPASSTAVALPDDMLAAMAADAKASAALERPAVSNISLKAGILSYNGDPVKGNKLRVVILAASHLNVFYGKQYDPDNISSPKCFALSETGEAMAPDGNVPAPCSTVCNTCPNAKWGSAIRDGKPSRGKACAETRRLVMLPESSLDSAEDVTGAELALVRLPVTSVKVWGGFVNTLAATVNLPHYAVVAELTTQPDLKSQFKVVLTPVEQVKDAAILRAILGKRAEAMRIAMMPYDISPEEEVDDTPEAVAANEKF
jgi:hypothetical protein